MAIASTHIYCPNCDDVRPLLVDEMPGTDTTGQYDRPTDLICDVCKLVIATTYCVAAVKRAPGKLVGSIMSDATLLPRRRP